MIGAQPLLTYTVISNLGHSVNQDPQQRTKHGNFLLTSEVNISETVADRPIVTINHI